jgi:exodeoxyribonuclease VII small subunit
LTAPGDERTLARMTKKPVENAGDQAPSPVVEFEKALDELERLVQKLESGEQSLDESLAAYERGVALYRRCQAALEQAELRVRLLTDPEQLQSGQDFRVDAE